MCERSGQDERMTALILVPIDIRLRIMRAPERRTVGKCLRPDRRKYGLGDADIDEADLAAMNLARQQKMSGLQSKERDGLRRLNSNAAHQPRRTVDPRGNVDGEDRLARTARPIVK